MASSVSLTVRPGHSTALARSRCLSARTANLGVSKYFGSGQKRRRVPVFFLPTVPTTSSGEARSPLRKVMRCSAPSRLMWISTRVDSALTTLTPTPCRPPEKV
ncbi:hypothetical protein D3C73_1384180 [compost metagenome]